MAYASKIEQRVLTDEGRTQGTGLFIGDPGGPATFFVFHKDRYQVVDSRVEGCFEVVLRHRAKK